MNTSEDMLDSIRLQHRDLRNFIMEQTAATDEMLNEVLYTFQQTCNKESYSTSKFEHQEYSNPLNEGESQHRVHFPALDRVLQSYAKRKGTTIPPPQRQSPSPLPSSHSPFPYTSSPPSPGPTTSSPSLSSLSLRGSQPLNTPKRPTMSYRSSHDILRSQLQQIKSQKLHEKDKKDNRDTKDIQDMKDAKVPKDKTKASEREAQLEEARRNWAATIIQRGWRTSKDFRNLVRYVADHRKARAHRKRHVLSMTLRIWQEYTAMRRWWKTRWANLVRCWGVKNVHLHLGREFPVTHLTLTEGKYAMAAKYYNWRLVRKFFLKWQLYMAS